MTSNQVNVTELPESKDATSMVNSTKMQTAITRIFDVRGG